MAVDGWLRADALRMDETDSLAPFRQRFYLQSGRFYMDGNSLGLLSRDAEAAVLHALDAWKTYGVEGWNRGQDPWFDLPEKIGALAAPLVGARPGECLIAGGTTINLHTLLATFYRPQKGRTKLLADLENFPSDLYAMASHVRLHDRPADDLVLMAPAADGLVSEDEIIDRFGPDVAVALLPGVWYKSGQVADIPRLTRAAHHQGIIIGFDLCHSIGALPHSLHDWDVDFAIWCNYKYLNAGPGSTAGLYVHERHHHLAPGLAGWFGSDKSRQFAMEPVITPAATASRWQIGTPPILSTVAVKASLEMFCEAGIENVRKKSLRQTEYLRGLLEQRVIADLGEGSIATPREPERRGGHVAYRHPHAVQLSRVLREAGVIPDFRPPDIVRLAPIPLYTSFTDIWDTVEILRNVLAEGRHRTGSSERDVVS